MVAPWAISSSTNGLCESLNLHTVIPYKYGLPQERFGPVNISEVARRAELSVQTIRFYEREGLLRKAERTLAGYGSYEERDLESVSFIRVCQNLGFTLRVIQQLRRRLLLV